MGVELGGVRVWVGVGVSVGTKMCVVHIWKDNNQYSV